MTAQPLLLDGPGRVPMDADTAYRALLERLYALSRGGTKLGLERTEQLMAELGHPERERPTVHVAGSNGKGSTSAFLASILAASGRRVGLFTSPHLVSLTERIQIVGPEGAEPIAAAELVRVAALVERRVSGFDAASFFEVMTALGLAAFRELGAELDVIEAGLGARLDSTRVVDAQVAVLTDLSLEHTNILGDTLSDIAREEGAVVRPGRPLVMADGPAEAMGVVDALAESAGAPVLRLGRDFTTVRSTSELEFDFTFAARRISGAQLSLTGPHQARNAALAVQAALLMDPDIEDDAIRLGLSRARWPGRMEARMSADGASVLLDGAQNAHAAAALATALEHPRFDRPLHFVFGALGDKDVGLMLGALAPRAASFAFTRPGSVRARTPESLRAHLRDLAPALVSEAIESPTEAFAAACARAARDGGWVVVCGSLYLVGDIRALLGDAA